jgi:hypothetical protein
VQTADGIDKDDHEGVHQGLILGDCSVEEV